LPDGNLELLLVAAKQEALDALTQTIVASGLNVPIIDVDVFAAHNAFEAFSERSSDPSTAIIHLGLRSSNISLRSSGQLMFAGDLASCVESVCEMLADALRVNQAESRRVLFADLNDSSQLQPGLTEVLRSVSDDIARRLNLIWQIADLPDPINSIVICGEGAHIPTLRRFLEDLTNRTVFLFDPLTSLSAVGESAFTMPSSFTIALGLALRSPGDRVVSLGGEG
jgi:type IV pilus assembly protein PilM